MAGALASPEACSHAGATACLLWRLAQSTLSVRSPPATTWVVQASVPRLTSAPSCRRASMHSRITQPHGISGRQVELPWALTHHTESHCTCLRQTTAMSLGPMQMWLRMYLRLTALMLPCQPLHDLLLLHDRHSCSSSTTATIARPGCTHPARQCRQSLCPHSAGGGSSSRGPRTCRASCHRGCSWGSGMSTGNTRLNTTRVPARTPRCTPARCRRTSTSACGSEHAPDAPCASAAQLALA